MGTAERNSEKSCSRVQHKCTCSDCVKREKAAQVQRERILRAQERLFQECGVGCQVLTAAAA
jgi:hypothetical protein